MRKGLSQERPQRVLQGLHSTKGSLGHTHGVHMELTLRSARQHSADVCGEGWGGPPLPDMGPAESSSEETAHSSMALPEPSEDPGLHRIGNKKASRTSENPQRPAEKSPRRRAAEQERSDKLYMRKMESTPVATQFT